MKKFSTLILSLSMCVMVQAADKYAQGDILWSTGPWYDSPIGGTVVDKPASGDNVFAGINQITVDENATCNNYTVGDVSEGKLIINQDVMLTVRGVMDTDKGGELKVDLFLGSHDSSTLKFTGEALSGVEPLIMVTKNIVESFRPRNMVIAAADSRTYLIDASSNPITIDLRNGTTTVKSGTKLLLNKGRTAIGATDEKNLFTIEEGATVTARIIEGSYDGKKVPAAKMIIDGTLIVSDRCSVRNLIVGENGTFSTQAGEAFNPARPDEYLGWDGWWNGTAPNPNPTGPNVAYGEFATPTALAFGDNSTIDFCRNGGGYVVIQGMIPENKVYSYYSNISLLGFYNDEPNPAFPVPYVNIKLSGNADKKLGSNTVVMGNIEIINNKDLYVPEGIVLVLANGEIISKSTGVLVADGSVVYAASSDPLRGSVSGTISATNEVLLTAVPKAGFKFVNWKTPSGLVVSTSAIMESFKSKDGNEYKYIANFDNTTSLSTQSTKKTIISINKNVLDFSQEALSVEVYDVHGRATLSQTNTSRVSMPSGGIYIVRIVTAQGVETQRILIRL